MRQMGADGWLALGWPQRYGGQNRSMIDQLIFTDEAAIAGAPVPFLTINSVAPTIMAFGTDEQKKFYLPKIASGDLHFSIGYSEPGAGTDLARVAAQRHDGGTGSQHQRDHDHRHAASTRQSGHPRGAASPATAAT